jgi:hypothetical protein
LIALFLTSLWLPAALMLVSARLLWAALIAFALHIRVLLSALILLSHYSSPRPVLADAKIANDMPGDMRAMLLRCEDVIATSGQDQPWESLMFVKRAGCLKLSDQL